MCTCVWLSECQHSEQGPGTTGTHEPPVPLSGASAVVQSLGVFVKVTVGQTVSRGGWRAGGCMCPCVSPQQELATGGTRMCTPSVHGSVHGSGGLYQQEWGCRPQGLVHTGGSI